MQRFSDYVHYREAEGEIPPLGNDIIPTADMEKLNKFLLWAVSKPNTFHTLLPQFQQLAAMDNSGQMNDLLQNLDWQSIKKAARHLLGHPNNDEPIQRNREKDMDVVKPHAPDMGKSDLE